MFDDKYEIIKELRKRGLTFAKIGAHLGVSRQRANQIYHKNRRSEPVPFEKLRGDCMKAWANSGMDVPKEVKPMARKRRESISSLVPNDDAEVALLTELCRAGGEAETAYIVKRAMAHFPILQTPRELERTTPSGRPWWPGRFRFDLNTLKKNGEAENVKRGYWRITRKGVHRIGKADCEQKEAETNLSKGVKQMATKTLTVEISEELYDRFYLVVTEKGGLWRSRKKKETAQEAKRWAVEVALREFLESLDPGRTVNVTIVHNV